MSTNSENDDNNVNDTNARSSKEDITKRHTDYYKSGTDQNYTTREPTDNKSANNARAVKIVSPMNIGPSAVQEKTNSTIDVQESTEVLNLGYKIFDFAKYNSLFGNNSLCDASQPCLQQFIRMSIEKNEFQANIYYNNLIKANWSPTFKDIENIFINWGADQSTLIHKPVLMSAVQKNDSRVIGWCNFELTINFITNSVLRKPNYFSTADMLTLAKYSITISFDYHFKQMINAIKHLFNSCIENALGEDTDSIDFSQYLYASYTIDDLEIIIANLFLPLESSLVNKIYSCLTYKLYSLFIGQDVDKVRTDAGIWYLQYIVNKGYFETNPTLLYSVIRLLDHVVFTYNLYRDEENMCNMYSFLYDLVKSVECSNELANILDRWRLELFYFEVCRRKKDENKHRCEQFILGTFREL